MLKRLPSILLIFAALLASPLLAANAIVRDGDTIQFGDVTYRLDGIEAPELDQICIDDHADPWSCGVDARDQVTKLIDGRAVRCDDLGPDKTSRKRHVGICTVEGEKASLNQQLVKRACDQRRARAEGALSRTRRPRAKADKTGLWKGCFVAPREFRIGKKDGALIGGACRADRDKEIRAVLFPENFAQPPACPIKGKFAARARFTGHVGIYHLQGCRSYAGLTRPDRWFCSEDDAQAAGFRRAYQLPRAKPAGK